MKYGVFPSRRKGFTLVELLVVISIVAALSAIAFSVVMKQRGKAELLESRKACVDIAGAIETFYTDYNTFPIAHIPKGEAHVTTSMDDPSELITILLGREKGSERNRVNKSGQKYLAGTSNEGPSHGIYIDGSRAGYYDPWGGHYFVIMDTMGKDEIADPTNPNRPIFKRKAIVYGMGPDQEGSAADKKIRDREATIDNVFSWK